MIACAQSKDKQTVKQGNNGKGTAEKAGQKHIVFLSRMIYGENNDENKEQRYQTNQQFCKGNRKKSGELGKKKTGGSGNVNIEKISKGRNENTEKMKDQGKNRQYVEYDGRYGTVPPDG